MVFTPGARQSGAELAVTERAAECGDSANDPKHEQGEPRLNIRELKAKTGKDAGANNVGNNDGRLRDESDSPPRRSGHHATRFSNCRHLKIDNTEIIWTSEYSRSGTRVHDCRTSP